MLIIQLDPPSLLPILKIGSTAEANGIMLNILPVLLQLSLGILGQSGAMESVRQVTHAIASMILFA
jgi:hypothetical protein